MALSAEAAQILSELNPWWREPGAVRPDPPPYRRPLVADLRRRLERPRGLIEVVRGPRQVGKTTGIYQIIQDLIRSGARPRDILFVRFDLELLREEPAALLSILTWYEREIRQRSLRTGRLSYLFLDEVHKLRRWHEEVKHAGDTYPLRMLLTGSSSVLVARGGRESLAGRVFTTELPAFSFREVVECWKPRLAGVLPPAVRFSDVFEGALAAPARAFEVLRPQQKLAIHRALERYYSRGGYPRLHSGEVDDDLWADYLVQTVFDNVLGADIPDLFPVESPQLLRHLYLSVARVTGQEIPQVKLAENANVAGIPTNQPTVGKYLHYLADALLIREFRRYPLAKKASARVPAKITVSDLGVRNAIFRGAPSLWESDPQTLGPLVETLVQGVIRDHNLQVHFYREFEDPADRRSRQYEVDFVAERLDGEVLPVEVKFRKRIDAPDLDGLRYFMRRFGSPMGVVVTRELSRWDAENRVLFLPLPSFLLAF
ncbi:MAG TPA: ATP-binding protein [Vicinamibacteria bacterium]|nr:ATP-binding protein [Vicinamibacteria bacterium]